MEGLTPSRLVLWPRGGRKFATSSFMNKKWHRPLHFDTCEQHLQLANPLWCLGTTSAVMPRHYVWALLCLGTTSELSVMPRHYVWALCYASALRLSSLLCLGTASELSVMPRHYVSRSSIFPGDRKRRLHFQNPYREYDLSSRLSKCIHSLYYWIYLLLCFSVYSILLRWIMTCLCCNVTCKFTLEYSWPVLKRNCVQLLVNKIFPSFQHQDFKMLVIIGITLYERLLTKILDIYRE